MCTGFLIDVLQVIFNSELTDAAMRSNLFVGETAKHKPCDTFFTWGERVGMQAPTKNGLQ